MADTTQIPNEDILGVEVLTFAKDTKRTVVFDTEDASLLTQVYLMKEQIGEDWGEGDQVRIIALKSAEPVA